MADTRPAGEFERRYTGRLWGILSWDQLTAFWSRIDAGAGWYLYAVGEPPPADPAAAVQVQAFVGEIDALLRREHHEDYCGIVYADDLEHPSLVKIYDPNHLGASCGSSKHPPLPGWVMSRIRPVDLQAVAPMPAARKRFWEKLFSR